MKLSSLSFNLLLLILLFAAFPPFMSAAAQTLPPCESIVSSELCEKIGQMLIVGFGGLRQDQQGNVVWEDPDNLIFNEHSTIAQEIASQHVGGVILFVNSFRNLQTGQFIRDRNIQNPQQVARLTQALRDHSKQTRQTQGLAALPLLITIDQEGGAIDRLPAGLGFAQKTLIPQALGAHEEDANENLISKSHALADTYAYAQQMASILQAHHFNVNFAPDVDVNINPLNPVIGGRGRSFSRNPLIVVDQARQFIRAFHEQNIIAVLKHFPGHGSSTADSHLGLVDVTHTYHKAEELTPYRLLIAAGFQDIVMTAHVINGQIDQSQCKSGPQNDPTTWCPATLSYNTITLLLRKQLGFKGVVVSDDMTMGAITQYPLAVALAKAINAGVDMFIVANNYEDNTQLVENTIAELVKFGKISAAQINTAYQRIVTLKNRLR